MANLKKRVPTCGVPRLVPDEPLPPYTFVPGRFPHPLSDPAGHSFGTNPAVSVEVDPNQWQQCRPYLVGLDLFNSGYYWESHVAWESLWMGCGRRGVLADFLKGLIKLAAAGVKALEGRAAGVRSHSSRAAELWRSVMSSLKTDQGLYMGFRVEELMDLAEGICAKGWPDQAPVLIPTLPKIVGTNNPA